MLKGGRVCVGIRGVKGRVWGRRGVGGRVCEEEGWGGVIGSGCEVESLDDRQTGLNYVHAPPPRQ